MFEKIKDFWHEVKAELKKVTWPDRKTTTQSTIVVLVVVFLVSAYLGVVDFVLGRLHMLVMM